ncbi:MAG: hypothetical protein R3F56_12285 [Planctomycetota bacterium]
MRQPALRSPRRLSAVVSMCALLALTARAQLRSLVPITSAGYDHRDALLSPDGNFVAFRGPSMLGVVAYGGGSEVPVVQANLNIGSVLWSPDSLGLYYLSGTDLRYVPRGGGNSRSVAVLPESGISLWDIKADGTELFGTWLYVRNNGSQVIRETHIFAIAADGSSAPRTVVTSLVTLDGVRLSPDGMRMVYREYDPTPFAPRDYMVANIDGSSPVSLTGGLGLNINAGLPAWRPDGAGIVYERIDRSLSRPVVEQLLLGNTTPIRMSLPEPARNLSVSRDGAWVVYEGLFASTNWSPFVMPIDGGGHIALDPSRPLQFAGTPQLGGPAGDRVVISGTLATASSAQVYKVELARELRVAPRAVTGGMVRFDLPVTAAELGVIFMAAALGPSFPIPGLGGAFQLDAATAVVVVSGTSSAQGTVGVDVQVPNVGALRLAPLALQGVRLLTLSPAAGDFTRPVRLPVF